MKKIILLLAVFITACGSSATASCCFAKILADGHTLILTHPIPPRRWSWLRQIKRQAESKCAWSAPRWMEKM